MANNQNWRIKFVSILSALSLVSVGAFVSISPASALDATPTTITFEDGDTVGAGAVGNNSGEDPTGSFSGLTTTIVDASNGGGTGKVLQMAKAGDPWAGVVIAKYDNLRINGVIGFDLYSPDPSGTTACVKIENAAANVIVEFNFAPTNGWANYELDLTTDSQWNSGAEYVTLVFFPNFGCEGASGAIGNSGQLYAIDNIELNGGTPEEPEPLPATATLLSFEDDDTIGAGAVGANSGNDVTGSFSGLTTTIETASNGGGTGKVLQMAKAGDPWAGVVITSFDDRKIGAVVGFDFYSPEASAGTAWIKLETAGAGSFMEMGFEASPGWNRYEIDLSTDDQWNGALEYVNLVFFPNYNGDGSSDFARDGQLYAIDNISLNGAEMPELETNVAPTKTKNPVFTGTLKVGKTLTANGYGSSWEGTPAPTLSYQWFACTKKGTNNPSVKPADCKSISGASAKKLTLKKAQKGKFIRVRVTATNVAGSAAVFSDSSKVKVS